MFAGSRGGFVMPAHICFVNKNYFLQKNSQSGFGLKTCDNVLFCFVFFFGLFAAEVDPKVTI